MTRSSNSRSSYVARTRTCRWLHRTSNNCPLYAVRALLCLHFDLLFQRLCQFWAAPIILKLCQHIGRQPTHPQFLHVTSFIVYTSFMLFCSACLFTFTVYNTFINPRRACAERVTVVVLCVCVYVCMYVCVCLSAHAILAVRVIKSVTKDTVVLNVRFAAIL